MTLLAQVSADRVQAGPFGLLIVLLLGIAMVLLVRNMNRRLKRLPREFPAPPTRTDQQPPAQRDGEHPAGS